MGYFFIEAAKYAPIVTALIAASAAWIAWSAIDAQKDIARRRAAIDFFLKTETDPSLIAAYEQFQTLKSKSQQLASDPNLQVDNKEVLAIRVWLNLCELIAVGVNLDAFSKRIAKDYWGDILPEAYETTLPLIARIRSDPRFSGSSSTYIELERLAKEWIAKRRQQ